MKCDEKDRAAYISYEHALQLACAAADALDVWALQRSVSLWLVDRVYDKVCAEAQTLYLEVIDANYAQYARVAHTE